jgi:hypothetical protein
MIGDEADLYGAGEYSFSQVNGHFLLGKFLRTVTIMQAVLVSDNSCHISMYYYYLPQYMTVGTK